jgi:hypothetical protein
MRNLDSRCRVRAEDGEDVLTVRVAPRMTSRPPMNQAKQNRLSRIPHGRPATRQASSTYLKPNADGTLLLDWSKVEPPSQVYVAEHAAVKVHRGAVGMFFAQSRPGKTDRLLTRLELRYPFEHFYREFWKNSREFHERLRTTMLKYAALAPKDEERVDATGDADQIAFMCVNYNMAAQTGSESMMDFYHVSPRSSFQYERTRDLSMFEFDPKVRVQLTSWEMLHIMDECDAVAKVIGPQLPAIERKEG